MKRPEKVTAEVQCALMEGTTFDFPRSFMGTNVLLKQIRDKDSLQPPTKLDLGSATCMFHGGGQGGRLVSHAIEC